jgi:uncharacterized membrane protein
MTIRWMSARAQSIALLVSLAVNVLLISAIAAYALQGHHHRDRGDRRAAVIERLAGRLPDADAAKLRSAYTAHLDEFKAARDEVRRLREAARTALRAQPFDPKAFQQAAETLAARRAAVDQAFTNVIAGAVIQMSPQGRARLLDRRHDR